VAEITVRDEAARLLFVVKFAVESGPRPTDLLPEAARLGLSFRHTPGSAHGESRQVGEFFYGQLDGAVDYYECPVEVSPANVAALAATGFAWSAAAAELAASHRVDPALVARIRADVDSAHQHNIRKMRWCHERLDAGDKSEEVMKAWREALEELAG
jgi:hypothetical protein